MKDAKGNPDLREFFKESERPYAVLADLHEGGHVVNFAVFEGTADDAKVCPLLMGFVKWDGCSNWHFPHEHYPLHFCTQTQAGEFGKLLQQLYGWAAELMPRNEEYLGK